MHLQKAVLYFLFVSVYNEVIKACFNGSRGAEAGISC